MPQTINRRRALTVVAAAPAAMATMPLLAQAGEGANYTPLEYPQHARSLWRRYIEAEEEFLSGLHAHEDAGVAARREFESVPAPWLYRGPYTEIYAPTVDGTRRTMVVEDCTGQRPGTDGTWLVLEYQPVFRGEPDKRFDPDNSPQRWQPYPHGNGVDTFAQSRQRSEKDWRSYCRKWRATLRRHKVPQFRKAEGERHGQCLAIAREIADAPCDCPAMVAVKIALRWVYEAPNIDTYTEWDSGYERNNYEESALLSIYRVAVSSGSFNPMDEWRAAGL